MCTRQSLVALCLTSLVLCGCGKAPADAKPSIETPVGANTGSSSGSLADTSVPTAASVVVPATQARPDPTAGRSNGKMSPAQESSAMPMPGQNNDHSAPLRAAAPAAPAAPASPATPASRP
jgi:hypothetical protein